MTQYRAPAPNRSIANVARRITPQEIERLAWQFRERPGASMYPSVSETSGEKRYFSHEEAEWLLTVTGVQA